ncbi:FtsX-like permease family protein [Massilia horti]|uniref:FtsX-like permease family protein n=1 Tax=Massilia horti TaxID=2562153 RepID=A0A4Y9T8Q1_9BURK|nr:FtsX-like permease family protein [Massilia horti]TFW34105.1 FtsX-like permease family protein [Massilia horti]
MRLNDLRIGWRQLAAEPAYSAVVIAGLAVGFAACFLLLGYVRFSLGYNSHVPDAEHVFVIKQKNNMLPRPEWQASAPHALRDAIKHSALAVTVSASRSQDMTARLDSGLFPLSVLAADTEFARMFGLRAMAGDLATAVTRPDSIALSESAARKMFGERQALGKTLIVGGETLRVAAIMRDMPANSSLVFDALRSEPALLPDSGDWRAWTNAGLFVRLGGGVDIETVLRVVRDAYARSPAETRMPEAMRAKLPNHTSIEFRAVPLADLYFDPDFRGSRAAVSYGNRDMVIGLAVLALLVLLLAGINYVNLATVRTLRRQREIGVRKAIGASRWQITRQFMAESLVVSMTATVLGLLLAWLLLPLFSDLMNRQLDGLFTPANLLGGLAFGMLTGLAAAAYPVWIALRVRAGESLLGRGTSETPHGAQVRRVLTVFQFAVAMALGGGALAVAWQTRYASNAYPGFDPEPLLVFDLPEGTAPAAARALRERIAHLPGVAGVAGISEAIGRDDYKLTWLMRTRRGDSVGIELKNVSPEFFDVYRVGPALGRVFHAGQDKVDDRKVVINASAALTLGFDSPEAAVGQPMPDDTGTIIGIAPDLRFNTLRHVPQPLLYRLDEKTMDDTLGVVTVRIDGDKSQVASAITALWRQTFPNAILDLQNARDLFAPNYASDRRLALALGLASAIATALAAFGIYVLSAYQVQRRAREIVLRKLYGAGRRQIGQLVGREFALLVGIGALIGLPLAALAKARYLAGFVERAPMGAWPLAAAFGFAALVALAACTRHTRAAMRIAPARALRD